MNTTSNPLLRHPTYPINPALHLGERLEQLDAFTMRLHYVRVEGEDDEYADFLVPIWDDYADEFARTRPVPECIDRIKALINGGHVYRLDEINDLLTGLHERATMAEAGFSALLKMYTTAMGIFGEEGGNDE